MTRMTSAVGVAAFILLAGYCAAAASDPASDIEALRQAVEQMKVEYERQIRSLEERLRAAEAAARRAESAAVKVETAREESALDEAVAEVEAEETAPTVTAATPPSTALWSRRFGGADSEILDISLNLMGAAGTSNVGNDKIEALQGGEHDPRRRGFTFQQAELGFKGAIDPYLNAETYIVASEEGVELEEGFFTTTALPYDLQLKGGYFLTEFGIINPTHPHSWDWIDQPVINTRLFGGEGQRAAGFRLSKLLPTPWYSELMIGSQDPTNSTMVSFQGRGHSHDEGEEHGHEEEEHEEEHEHISGDGVGGYVRVRTDDVDSLDDLTWFARWVNGWDFNEQTSGQLGFSFLLGSNTTGKDGETYVFGSDLKLKWLPTSNFRGYPYVKWETEGLYRYYDVDRDNPSFQDPDQNLGNLKDWGLRTELGWGFKPRWETGLRFEYANGNDKGPVPKDDDELRDRRYRVSPILSWRPTEYSRFRLQYNWDDAQFLTKNAHSVWLGFDLSLGAHPAHKY